MTLTPPTPRSAVLANLVRAQQANVPAHYVMTGLTFRFGALYSDPLTVLCEPTVHFRDPHSIYPGTLRYGLIHQVPSRTPEDGMPVQEILGLSEGDLETLMRREAQAWFAAQEQERITRDEARAQRWWARVSGRSLLQVAAFLAASAVAFGLNRLLFPSAPLLLSVLIVSASLAVIATTAWHLQLAAVPNTPPLSLWRAPTPASPPRTLDLIPGEYWHAQIGPATTGTPSTAAPGSVRAQVERRGLGQSRATLEASRDQLMALRAQAQQSQDTRDIDALIHRAEEGLTLIAQREHQQNLHVPLSDVARTIDTELHYLAALPKEPTS